MTKLIISPSWEEQRSDRARYEDLAADLAALGFDVELEDPPEHSAQALDPFDVAIYLGNMVASEVGHHVMDALFRRLREKRKDTHPDLEDPPYRSYVIYGPDGEEILAEARVPAE